jgi:type IV secretory pathway TraG/TraD family ATPase VirD4
MIRKLYRLLTTLVTLLAVLVIGWLLLRDDAARAKDQTLEGTSDARKTAELAVAGVWMWGHQALLGPVEPQRRPSAPPREKTRRGVARASGRGTHHPPRTQGPSNGEGAGRTVSPRRHRATPTPEPSAVGAARDTVRRVMDNARAGRDTSFPTEWYGRPVQQRWEQYQSAPWAPIRTATRYTFLLLGGLVLLGTARYLGFMGTLRVLASPPRWLMKGLRVFTFSYFRPRLQAGDTHGTARWASAWQLCKLRARRNPIVLGRVAGQHRRSLGGPLGAVAKLRRLAVPAEWHFYHLLAIAPSGMGKTARLIIPWILRECLEPPLARLFPRLAPERRSFIAADLKGELAKKTSRAARRTHNVMQLAFLEPGISVRHNYLHWIKTPLQAERFAQVWVANTGQGREEFWADLSQQMIGIGITHLVATKEGANLRDLYDLLYPHSPEEIVAILQQSPSPQVKDATAGMMASMAKNEKLVGAAYVDMQRRIRSIGLVPELAEVTSEAELDLEAFGQEPTALYIKFDADYKATLAPYVSCFFAQLTETLIRQAEARGSGRLEVPVIQYLDEFGNIGQLPSQAERVTLLRSYGIAFFMVIQEPQQLEKLYGEADAQTIFTGAGTKIVLPGLNDSAARRFSELAGRATVLAESQGDSREIVQLPWATGGNRGVSEVGRDLIDPTEIRTMQGEVLVIQTNRRPLLANPTPWYKSWRLRRMVPDLERCNPMLDFARPDAQPDTTRPADDDSVPADTTDRIDAWAWEQAEMGRRLETIARDNGVTAGVRAHVEQLEAAARSADERGGDDAQSATGGQAAGPSPDHDPARHEPKPLSPKQRDLLFAIEAHPEASASELAGILGWTDSNVRSRLSEVRAKLGADVGDDLVGIARGRGMLEGRPAIEPAYEEQLSFYTIPAGADTGIPDYRDELGASEP